MPSSRPSIGLALSGGAARGLAHIGVLRALEENNIPIDFVAGSSAGSIVGGAYAAGMSIDEIEAMARGLRWRHVGRMTISRLGFQSNKRLEKFVRDRLPKKRFEELAIPFAVLATDLNTGDAVVMKDKGDLAFAIRASCTIPGLYVPVADDQGRQLVDGGLVAVIPAKVARSFGADIVIAVDVNSAGATFFGSSLRSVFGVLLQSMILIQKSVSHHQLSASDFVISPRVGHIRWDQLRRSEQLIAAGYEAGAECAPAIKALIEKMSLALQPSPESLEVAKIS